MKCDDTRMGRFAFGDKELKSHRMRKPPQRLDAPAVEDPGQAVTTHQSFRGVAMVKTKLPLPGQQESGALRELKLICMSSLLSTTDERVYFKDLQSRFLFLSAGWIAACAPVRTAEELIGKTDFDVFSAQHASAAFEDEQQIIRTGEPLVDRKSTRLNSSHLGISYAV